MKLTIPRLIVIAALLILPSTLFAADDATPAKPESKPAAKLAEKAATAGKNVTMETSLGMIVIELFDDKAPVSAANFRKYVQEGYYDGLIFHRVIRGFVIQGGGFEPGMKVRPPKGAPIRNEADNGLNNERGTLSMARTSDINSATSQFFINLNHNRALDHTGNTSQQFGYAVFGKVIKGMDVVDKIAAIPTGQNSGFRDVPKEDVVIGKAYESK